MDRILLGTRKGTIILDRNGAGWNVSDVGHYGVNVSLVARDPRDGTLWAGLDHGHWGTKLSRSTDNGKTWADAPQIMYPEDARYIDSYEKDENGEDRKPVIKNATLGKIWAIAFGGPDQPGRIWVGTIPGGLFRSDDGGETWELNRPLWNHESRGGTDLKGRTHWFGGGATVNGQSAPGIHSIVVDPRDSKRVLIGVSCAGVLETTDDGETWVGRNKGLKATFLPDPDAEWGHDPHLVSLSPSQPDHLWQQNHCGVFYSNNGGQQWQEVSKPEHGIHFGFPVAVDENDGRTAWLVPGRSDMQRMTVGAGLFVARTQDGGQSWQHLREGLPQDRAHDIVYRHALDIAGDQLAFGSTTGNLYFSADRGESWHTISNNLPPIHSVKFAQSKTTARRVSGGAKTKKAAASPGQSAKPTNRKGSKASRGTTGGTKKAAPKKKPAKKATTKKAAPEKKAKQSPGRMAGDAKRKPATKKKAATKTKAKARRSSQSERKPKRSTAARGAGGAKTKRATTSPSRKAGVKKAQQPKEKPTTKRKPKSKR
jgi:photosystem II stability/assembly factor-like uncharacterized protein